ncbi:MAG: HAMP domain-containing histidine kinase [Spirochaetales bacterium]|nr:HAMP domain-containing histidine kinase [Spirochaetales bacterium]
MSDSAWPEINEFLQENREVFIRNWQSKLDGIFKVQNQRVSLGLAEADFQKLFDVYLHDIREDVFCHSNQYLKSLVTEKIKEGFLLSKLEFINASFMTTARELFRSVYPDAFGMRTEYLQRLSELVLNNEVMMARHYEEHLLNLNRQLREKADANRENYKKLSEFIDGATHHLQSPLWSIIGFVSKLQRNYYETIDKKGRHYLNRITANVSMMHQLIEDVTKMLLIDENNMTRKELFLYDILFYACRMVKNELDEDFQCDINENLNLKITGDPAQLKQLFYQLFKNAAQYTFHEQSGFCRLWGETCGEHFFIYIEDQGIGIEEQHRDLIFEPMERLKEKEIAGSGLGLTFAKRIMMAHKGGINLIDPFQSTGLCVKLDFPASLIKAIDKTTNVGG